MATVAARSDRAYVAWIVAAILVVVLAGFSRSFFLAPFFAAAPEWAAREPIFYLHGAVFSAWFALLAVQAWLIRGRAQRLHRQLGYGVAGVGVAVVLLGCYVALRAANRPTGFMGVPFPPEQFLIVPLVGIGLFAAFLGLAVINRNRAASHKRLILLASISLLGAPVARIPAMVPALPFWLDLAVYAAFVAALAFWDLHGRGRLRPETLWGGLALVALNLAALPLAQSAAWQNAARWMMGFTGPP